MGKILPILFLLTLAFVVGAQTTHEKLAGEWQINAKKTPAKDLVVGTVWTISLKGDSVKIRRASFTGEIALDLLANGKGESNGVYGLGNVRSKTIWSGDELIRTYFIPSPAIRPTKPTENTETYRLSKDGNTLTYELTGKMEGSYGDPSIVRKLVFDRKN